MKYDQIKCPYCLCFHSWCYVCHLFCLMLEVNYFCCLFYNYIKGHAKGKVCQTLSINSESFILIDPILRSLTAISISIREQASTPETCYSLECDNTQFNSIKLSVCMWGVGGGCLMVNGDMLPWCPCWVMNKTCYQRSLNSLDLSSWLILNADDGAIISHLYSEWDLL